MFLTVARPGEDEGKHRPDADERKQETDKKMPHWVYRGEGNAHIVVSNEQTKIVYRMFKRKKNGSKKLKSDYQPIRTKLQRNLGFTTNVMLPRITPNYLRCGSLVEISHSMAKKIKDSLEDRPEYRQDKELDETCPYVLEMPDYCRVNRVHELNGSPPNCSSYTLPVYTIEIKPKWGFIPVTNTISEERKIKYSVCRFCMHQHLKMANGKWKLQSYYCPIDLFSGEKDRMKHALKMLFKSPQNNLRVFKDGKDVWNDMIQARHDNSDILFLEEFIQSSPNYIAPSNCPQDIESLRSHLDSFLELLVQCLLHTPAASPAELRSTPSLDIGSVCVSPPARPAELINSVSFSQPAELISSVPSTDVVPVIKSDCQILLPEDQDLICVNGSEMNGELKNNTIKCSQLTGEGSKLPNGFKNGICREFRMLNGCVNTSLAELKDVNGHEVVDPRLLPQKCEGSTFNPRASDKVSHTAEKRLPEGSVLHQIHRTQLLDDMDIEGIMPLYEKVCQQLKHHNNSDLFDFNGPYDGNWCPGGGAPCQLTDEVNYAVWKIKEFLVSRSAKDCSIMISVQRYPDPIPGTHNDPAMISEQHTNPDPSVLNPAPDSSSNLSIPEPPEPQTDTMSSQSSSSSQDSDGNQLRDHCSFLITDNQDLRHLASIAVIDLDPKPLERIPHYMKEDAEVVKCYMEYVKKCSAQSHI